MKYWALALVFISTNSWSKVYPSISKAQSNTPSRYSQVVLGGLWSQAGHPKVLPYKPVDKKEVPQKKIAKKKVSPKPKWQQIKKPKFKPTPTPIPTPKPVVKPKVVKKELSRGQKAIQEQLKRNREKLKAFREAKKTNFPSNLNRNTKSDSNDSKSLREQYLNNLSNLKRQTKNTYSTWKSYQKETLTRWKNKRKDFHKSLPTYKKALFQFEAGVEIPSRELKATRTVAPKGKYHIIPGALDVPTRNQGKRPTCASFAGIRAIETILRGHGNRIDLSEQYFYWSSKPECQRSPCPKRGSWVTNGFKFSKSSNSADIPSESSCPYVKSARNGNETQVPLPRGCYQGKVKVHSYSRLSNINQITKSILANRPVIAGFKLTPTFYDTLGLVKVNQKSKRKMDNHSKGHALLLIGTMNLPKRLHFSEGKICYIVANSWGEGWGRGGFGCLSERWVKRNRIKNAFMALNSVRMD